MKSLRLSRTSRTGTWLIATVGLLAIGSAFAQRDRITHVLDSYKNVVVRGHLNPMAKAEFDHGAVPGDFLLRGMTLTVRRTAAQQQDLNRLLAAQQNPSSPHYHKWLTPEEFAQRFGASPNDMATLREWLESRGLRIDAVARGRSFVRFDATAAQVRDAFGTEIHYYTVNGVKHYANSSEPSLPANLAPLVQAVGGMNDFTPHPNHAQVSTRKGALKPNDSFSTGSGNMNTLAPGDLATIYDIGPLQTAVNYGAGQTVVVVGASDVLAGDLTAYCGDYNLASFGCGGSFTQVFPANDEDPGIASGANFGMAMQATMDVELVSAIAPGAALVLDADTNVWNALSDAVDNNLGQIVVMSYGQCETAVDPSLPGTIQGYAQQANSQGITVIAASGDTGAAGCDSTPLTSATGGLAVDLPAAIPEVTGVGGTEFNDQSSASWNSTTGMASQYIPEISWNDTFGPSNQYVAATGGGVSTVFPTPSWQLNTTGILNTGRNVPDVALSGSPFTDPYMGVVTMSGPDGPAQQTGPFGGGTEASVAVFAGIVALMNEAQGTGASSGNINPAIYSIAGLSNAYTGELPPFHAIVSGGNQVPCTSGTGCLSGLVGYAFGAPYDQATGLGSVDAYNLSQALSNLLSTPTISNVSVSTATAGHGDLSVTITGTNFTSGSTVTWTSGSGTTTLSSTYSSATSMSATVPAADLSAVGSASIQVVSAGNISSNSEPFTIAAAPANLSLSPSIASAGHGDLSVSITGTGFTSASYVQWNSQALTLSSPCSATNCSVTVPQADLAAAGSGSITVWSSDGVSSSPATFTITAAPASLSLSPSTATAGHGDLSVSITGTGFTSASYVKWNAQALTLSSPCSATNCSVTVPQADLAAAGSGSITVWSSDGVSSSPATFTIASAPANLSLSPSTATAGHGDLSVSITGTGFTAASYMKWNSQALTLSAPCSATNCSVTVPQADLAAAGSGSITVWSSDGVSSSSATFTITAAPASLSLSPSTATAGHGDLAVSITGTGFTSASSVKWNSQALTLSSPCSTTNCSVTVPLADLAAAGSGSMTVWSWDGISSSPATFTIAPPPVITGVVGTATATNINPLPLTIQGSGFTSGSTVSWKFHGVTTPLTTFSYTNASSMSATPTVPELATAGNAYLIVVSADGVPSTPFQFAIASPPAIASLSPSSATAGSSDLSVTITGTGFTSGSVVKWNAGSTPLASSYTSATSMSATVPARDLTTAGNGNYLTVVSADGVSSAHSTFALNAAPTITSLSVSSATAGNAGLSLTITGNYFTSGSVVKWAPTASGASVSTLASSYSSPTTLVATVTAAELAGVDTPAITVWSADGVSSNSKIFTINPVPVITGISPSAASAGSSSPVGLTVTGTGFTSGSTVTWNGRNKAYSLSGSSCANATTCTATVPASYLTTAGLVPITVKTADGVSSAGANFSIASAIITGFTPNSVPVNGNAFVLAVSGTGFAPGAVIQWWNQNATTPAYVALPTVFVSNTELTGAIAANQIPYNIGSVPVEVVNNDGTTSVPVNFTITANGAPTITSVSPSAIVAGTNGVAVTVTGTGFIAGTTNKTTKVFTPGAQLYVNGSATGVTVTANTTTSIAATIPGGATLNSAGVLSLTVANANSSASSAVVPFNVVGPTIASVSPNPIPAGVTSATITVTGANFIAGSTDKTTKTFTAGSQIYVNGSATGVTVTAGTAASITATIPALSSVGTDSITVVNTGGAVSSPYILDFGAPAISSLSSTSAVAGSTPFTLSVYGTNFGGTTGSGKNIASVSTVYWGSTALATTYTAATTKAPAYLTAAVTATQLAASGPVNVTVENGSVASSPSIFDVNGPTITTLSPATEPIGGLTGSQTLTLTVNGTNFVGSSKASVSTVYWGSTALATKYVGATSNAPAYLTATLTATELGSSNEVVPVSVQNAANAVSNNYMFGVGVTVEQLSAYSASAGSVPFTLTVTGTGYGSSAQNSVSTVMWGSTPLATTWVSATQLTAAVTATQLASAGQVNVTVQNGTGSNAVASPPLPFNVGAVTVASLSANSAVAGSAPFTLTVTGTNFISGANASTVMWGSTPLTTTYVSATKITAAVTAAQFASAGPVSVTVQNGSGSSAAFSAASTFNVNGPTITGLSSTSIAAGSAGFTLTVTGTNFVSGANTSPSTVMWGTTPLATTPGSATQITAQVTTAELLTTGAVSVTVQNGSLAPTPSAIAFTVGGPAIGLLSPSTAAANTQVNLTVTGTGFVSGSKVMWGATQLATTFVSATSLTAVVPSANNTTPGPVIVTVVLPSNVVSTPSTFTVGPTIASLSSNSASAGSAPFTLTVTGTYFGNSSGSTVYWGSTALTTTYVSDTSLTASVTATQLATPGTVNITVKTAGGASSLASTFTVNGPTIASLSSNSADAGAAGFALTVTGTNFVSGANTSPSTVFWGSTALTTTPGSATQITAAVPTGLLATAGPVSITVQNGSSAVSAASTFTVNAVPTIGSLSQTAAAVGDTPFTLTVTGTNFVGTGANATTVMWGQTALATTFVSATQVTAAVTSAQLASAGAPSVTVQNGVADPSTATTFTVNPAPTLTSLSSTSATHGGKAFTLTLTGTNFVTGSTVMFGSATPVTTFVSASSLTAAVTAADIAAKGAVNVTVVGPGGSTTSAITFTVN